jgi:hypothetical protein
VAVKVPFTVRNTTYGRDVRFAMLRRTLTQPVPLVNTYKLGAGRDTLRVNIPEDQWVPGNVLYFIETVTQDSLAGAHVVLDPSGQPFSLANDEVTFTAAVVGCNTPNPPYCNPRGGWVFDLTAPLSASTIAEVTGSALARIRVVPNPFVIHSLYQTTATDSRLLFTNLPPRGTLRIYTVSGQFVQQITWTPDDLSATGDLV